jgi:hypothetical protein
MENKILEYPGADESLLCPGADFSSKRLRGKIAKKDLGNGTFWQTVFEDVDARFTVFREADLRQATFIRADLRGADFSDAKEFHTIRGLNSARFSDDTCFTGIDLTLLDRVDPRQARRIREFRHANAIKNQSPKLYWIWQLLCECGRSWPRLLAWGLVAVILFTMIYCLGLSNSSFQWLPHLIFTNGKQLSAPFISCLEFSAMTLVTFNMPDVNWTDTATGFWVSAEAWIGLGFVGVFISVLASKMASI